MRKLKRIFIYVKMKLQGHSKDVIYETLVFKNLMTFEEYEKYFDKRIMKEEYYFLEPLLDEEK